MDISKKLQIKSGNKVYVENAPAGFLLDLPSEAQFVDTENMAGTVPVFVTHSSELGVHSKPFIDAVRRDALAYITYPKAGQLGTNLKRDVLWCHLVDEGLRGVRQIALDDVW